MRLRRWCRSVNYRGMLVHYQWNKLFYLQGIHTVRLALVQTTQARVFTVCLPTYGTRHQPSHTCPTCSGGHIHYLALGPELSTRGDVMALWGSITPFQKRYTTEGVFPVENLVEPGQDTQWVNFGRSLREPLKISTASIILIPYPLYFGRTKYCPQSKRKAKKN